MGSKPCSDNSGIALFMVIAAITVLSVLVTEFVYVAQVNQRMAYDGTDQIKAHYLAKTGLKLSLLRLKAFQHVKATLAGGAASGMVPKSVLEKIWSFPFFYPIPTAVPGLSGTQKEEITKFQSDSSLEGKFTAVITSESSHYNLNAILAPYAAPSPSPSGGPTIPGDPNAGAPPGSPGVPAGTGGFDPEKARKGLNDFLGTILANQYQADPDFASEYQRDFRLEDFVANLVAWIDRSYQSTAPQGRDPIPPKGAPLYSLTELHMIEPLDDKLYDLFAPNLTVATTPGVNVNTMEEPMLRALVPNINKEGGEVDEFFKFRDSQEEDNQFKTPEDFFKYLQKGVGAFRGDAAEIERYKKDLDSKHIRIVTDEQNFKITVQAQVNKATRLIEAWVTLNDEAGSPASGKTRKNPNDPQQQTPDAGAGAGDAEAAEAGLKITSMRIL